MVGEMLSDAQDMQGSARTLRDVCLGIGIVRSLACGDKLQNRPMKSLVMDCDRSSA